MYTIDHTFSYGSKKFICACTKSSAHAHGTKIRDGNVKLLETTMGSQGNGWFTTDLQGRIWTSDGEPRTGMSTRGLPKAKWPVM